MKHKKIKLDLIVEPKAFIICQIEMKVKREKHRKMGFTRE